MLEDSPTEDLFESMHIISGLTTEQQLFSENSLRRLLSDKTANTILNFMRGEIVRD